MKLNERLASKYHGQPQKAIRILRDDLLTGFAMKVSKTGRISFCTEARIAGRGGSAVRRTIGTYPAFSVKDAREIASENLKLMYLGKDPAEVKKSKIDIQQEADSWTLGRVLEEYKVRRDIKDRTKRYYTQVVKQVYSDWLPKPITGITRAMVEERFFEHTKSIGGISTRILSALMNYSKAVTLSNGDRLITENPVDILKEKRISRVLPRREITISPKELSDILGRLEGHIRHEERMRFNRSSLMAIYVIALTAARKSEILYLKKEDVKLEQPNNGKLGYFILRDTKNRQDHVIPITEEISWVMKLAYNSNPKSKWMFPNNIDPEKSIRNPQVATNRFLGDYTLHDCRRTFMTVADELGISLDAIKSMVNHKSQDVTMGYIFRRPEQILPRLHKLFTLVQREMLDWKHMTTAEELFGLTETGQE
jgi:integrase